LEIETSVTVMNAGWFTDSRFEDLADPTRSEARLHIHRR